jgi:hypothetical protein
VPFPGLRYNNSRDNNDNNKNKNDDNNNNNNSSAASRQKECGKSVQPSTALLLLLLMLLLSLLFAMETERHCERERERERERAHKVSVATRTTCCKPSRSTRIARKPILTTQTMMFCQGLGKAIQRHQKKQSGMGIGSCWKKRCDMFYTYTPLTVAINNWQQYQHTTK